ncbi:MAG: peptidoglycan DD-metalloendopeptidase family protein [Tepidimonas ignava]|uniref:Lipoprotein NlpD n=1 Tax=Tepidimonas ignava TaxID=114249 RepID=A0A4R3LIH9_9BURK|nr:peptidoglycan DD-metalloendopeptidase family protein [Tepidimonas ignava]MCX7692161.1 peptidoglycan DD-metalloendopeptidase family protein [Tepidimonas taiwanensis]TCS99530.1 lipoprotein NlpD [Tepidimonas ignava]TSE18632.1 Murein hydrolase activator NlpD [Tepidimonas ignava]
MTLKQPHRCGAWLLAGGLLALLAGCAAPSKPARTAPVEDRRVAGAAAAAPLPAPAPATPATPPPPGSENAGKPGYYTVRPGDTLYRIGLEHGHSWRDLAAWNNLSDPNRIEVGQVLRVVPPTAEPVTAGDGVQTQPVAAVAPVQARPLETPPSGARSPSTTGGGAPAAANGTGKPAPAASATPEPTPAKAAPADAIALAWPARGPVLYHFDEVRNKGIGIGGKAGDPVLAAADGRVVYAGSDLRGYGNLVIIKHNNTYLTAYAHNQTLLVREDQTVRQGQKIAEMGNTDADRVKLHFEVRRQGKPVDPLSLLPSR